MKLKLVKCNFFKKQVEFLGRVVNENGYTMSDKSVQAVRELAKLSPKNVGQVRQLLGLMNYHRRSIQDFAKLAKPISDLLLADNYKGKLVKKKEISPSAKPKNNSLKKSTVSSKTPIVWEHKHQEALEKQ